MIVSWWLYDEGPSYRRWNGTLDSAPQFNSTGRSFEDMQQILLRVYNEANGTTLTADDFTWNEVPAPEPLTVEAT